jgi:hypothetical protein
VAGPAKASLDEKVCETKKKKKEEEEEEEEERETKATH